MDEITARTLLVIVGVLSIFFSLANISSQRSERKQRKLGLIRDLSYARWRLLRDLENMKVTLHHSHRNRLQSALPRGAVGGYLEEWKQVVEKDKDALASLLQQAFEINSNIDSLSAQCLSSRLVELDTVRCAFDDLNKKYVEAEIDDAKASAEHRSNMHTLRLVETLASKLLFPQGSDMRRLSKHPFNT